MLDIKDFFLKNGIQETLNYLLDNYENDEFKNIAVNVARRYYELRRDFASGIVTYEQKTVQLSEINAAILFLIDEVDRKNLITLNTEPISPKFTIEFGDHEKIELEEIYKLSGTEKNMDEIDEDLSEIKEDMMNSLNELPLISNKINALSIRYNKIAEGMQMSDTVNIVRLKKKTKKYFNDVHSFTIKLLTTVEDITEDIKDLTIIQLLMTQEIIVEHGEVSFEFLESVKSSYRELSMSLNKYLSIIKVKITEIESVIKELKPYVNTSKMKGAKKNLVRIVSSLEIMISYSDKYLEGYEYLQKS